MKNIWKFIGSFFRFLVTVKGALYLVGVAPAVISFFSGWLDGLSTSAIVAYSMLALVSGLAAVSLALWIYERATLFLTSRRQQERIMQGLLTLGEDVTELDIPTAAGIWAGTYSAESVERHLNFRGLKSAARRGLIKTTYTEDGKVNVRTKLDLESLKEFWRKKGVIR
ncbi:hypothetical protein AAFN88_08725 [Pelagibius sp. CAU 1746]|uniref:hypothetical protein n=1 Tax=Pelagibius sp. CAU 1746 TaxID=3140370 RepID=UPI00325BEB48